MAEKNKYFSCYIENYEHKTGIPLRVKAKSILFLWGALLISILLLRSLLIAVLLLVIGVAVTVHIFTMKTRVSDDSDKT